MNKKIMLCVFDDIRPLLLTHHWTCKGSLGGHGTNPLEFRVAVSSFLVRRDGYIIVSDGCHGEYDARCEGTYGYEG